MKNQLLRLSPRAHVRRTVTRALWKGVNVISVISLVLSTSFAGLTVAPQPLHAGEIKGLSLSGAKFNDLNGNGTWDEGEPGLPGWTINLWTSCSRDVLDYTHDDILNLDDSVIFTEKYSTGDITADANADGVVDAADMACANDAYSDGVITSSPSGILQTQITDASGNYNFSELPSGTYWLGEVTQDGWTQTTTPTIYGPLTDSSQDNNFGNFHATSISGMKFNDLNGNGDKEEGEPGLKNWTIRLWSTCDITRADYNDDGQITLSDAVLFTTPYVGHDNAADIHTDAAVNVVDYDCMNALVNQSPADGDWYVIRTTLTNGSGNYTFADLPAGDYRVDEVQKAGWTKTVPNGAHYSMSLVSNGDITNKDFGNFHNGSIAGMKFNDLNGNGTRDEGDAGLPDWTIKLSTQCSVSRADYNEDGVVTLADAVLFTTPYIANDLAADIRVDSAVNPLDKSCMDALVNGAPSEGPWVVVQTTTTDLNGNYNFSGLVPGDYRVSEEQQVGWTKTLPTDDFYALTLATDENVIGKNFGNFKNASVSGHKFNDVNGDGNLADGTPLASWTINATQGETVKTTTTNESGEYSFSFGPTEAGSWVISEVHQTGWTQTAPESGTFTVNVSSGTNITNEDFGNHSEIRQPIPPTETGPAISLTKTDNPTDSVNAGGTITYTLTWKVSNASVTNLVLVDPLPAGTTFVSSSDGGTYTAATRTVTWLLGAKAPATGSVTVVLAAPSPIANGTVITNTASLDSNETDPASASQTTTVTSAPALTIVKTSNVNVANPGNTITYTVKVTNNGTDAAKDVVLNDVLPQGFTTLDSGASKLVIGLGIIAAGANVSTTYQTTTTTTLTDGPYTNTATASATNAASITAHADVIMRAPAVLGAETAGPQPEVLGAETTLPATGTGVTDYMIALFGIIALAVGIRLTRQSIKE